MIRQGHELTADETVSCDVLVIGSGCGGATLAASLAERGRDVVILEKGGYWTKEDFDQREEHMLAKIDGGRGLDTSDDGGVALTYGNNVGGASVHYWADSYRLPEDRLALWEGDYGIEGHGGERLRPLWERLEADLNVHVADDSYVNEMNRRLKAAADAFGWKVERVPQARRGCVRSGHCMQGCSYDAKQSQLVTHIPRALANGARLYADVEASLLVWQGRRVAQVLAHVQDRARNRATGVLITVEPKIVVLAAGGYGTPRFLVRQGLQ
ncbi:MAG: GMC family oxidoreductase N-terminal domain-containing protein, partial [Myxococcales bacterium]|nr:GMC family oxidoreductase N-terminal domain-containing protein [Myxococcales bacterium]